MPSTRRKSTKQKSTKNNIKESVEKLSDNESLPCCYESEKCPANVRKILKEKLLCNSRRKYFAENFLVDQQRKLYLMVEQCVLYGESNSILVVGPRGSGKTKLIEKVLSDLPSETSENYFHVYLNGVIHTDDRTALQHITRELNLDNVVGDRVFGSFADNLIFLLDSLKQDSGESKSIIVVLDEFDLFANHKNQSLLYNFFDIAQSRQNPLLVIGITCRLDVIELLEKRVKSRFSHRSLLSFPSYEFEEYQELFIDLLDLPDSYDCPVYKTRWKKHLKELLKDGHAILQNQFNINKTIGSLVQLLVPAVCKLKTNQQFIQLSDLQASFNMLHIDMKKMQLKGLSTLELALMLGAKHVLQKRDDQPFNFEMVYHEYEEFSKRQLSGMQLESKPVAFKAFERLISLELIISAESTRQANSSAEYKLMNLLLDESQIKDIMKDSPTSLKNWADSMFA